MTERDKVNTSINLPDKVTICEVAPRDGFQAITDWIDTENKIKTIKLLAQTGIKSLEITSFVHPKAIPQLKDAEEVVTKTIDHLDGINIRALVPNLKGAERAIASGVTKLKTMLSATDSHSIANANARVEEAQQKLTPIFELAAKHNVTVMGSISVAFGCAYEGIVPVESLIEIIKRYEAMGVEEVSLADSTGMAHPKQVYETLSILKDEFPNINYSMHFHNTRGTALANVLASLQQGITLYDSSIAGIGGCPYIPNATGNVATEDLVHMLEQMNVQSGIDLEKLIETANEVINIVKVQPNSYMLASGPASSLFKKPAQQEKIGE